MTRRLEAGPLLVTLGAVLLLISLFMDWYEPGITAWQAFEVWDLMLFLLALGCIAAGIGLTVPDVDVVDRRWLPAAVALVAIVAASQIIDPPPAAAEQDPEAGAWMALGSAVLMCVGGMLTFGRVHLALTMEGRDPRRRVEAVDARRPADPVTESHEPVGAAEPAAEAPAAGGVPAARGGRLFPRSPAPAQDRPSAVASDTTATEPMPGPEGNEPPAEKKV